MMSRVSILTVFLCAMLSLTASCGGDGAPDTQQEELNTQEPVAGSGEQIFPFAATDVQATACDATIPCYNYQGTCHMVTKEWYWNGQWCGGGKKVCLARNKACENPCPNNNVYCTTCVYSDTCESKCSLTCP